ncbi:MAG: putative toxin-antitoxin system toxin component, PIN family [Acidobacteria bacterium]|nr:putative toxin-antitoxin system toxin component, PIN family [Acidobacteriota bacterium]
MIKATLDTSVYVRAFHFGGPAVRILGAAKSGTIRLDISSAILDETARVLRDKFRWDGYMVQQAKQKLESIGNLVVPVSTLHVVREDPADDRILECAAAANSDFIVSQDKDLLRLGQFANARVVTIREFLQVLLAERY